MKKQTGADWLKNTWRPLMAWLYLVVCAFDFVIFPAAWPTLQTYFEFSKELTQWNATTLQGGALFHIAMGAILGISAWTRGYEKIEANKGKQNEE